MRALLSSFSITLRRNYLQNISLIEVWNQRGIFLTYGLPIRSILFRIVRICRSWFKCNYLKNKKHFLSVFFHLWNLHQISNILKKKKNVIAYVFPKLTTDSELIRPFTKNHRVRTSFDSQHVKVFQILLKSPWEHFYHIFRSINMRENDLENIFLIEVSKRRGVC